MPVITRSLHRSSWVFSSGIDSSNHEGYDPSKSTTSKAAGSKWEVCYDGGRCVIGDLYSDTVSVGGITIDGQAVGVATQINNADFLNEGFDGVFGLSLHQKSSGENLMFIFCFIEFKSSSMGTDLLLDI